MTTPKRFRITVRRTQITTVYEWVDQNGVGEADKAAAIGRAKHVDQWDKNHYEIIGIEEENFRD